MLESFVYSELIAPHDQSVPKSEVLEEAPLVRLKGNR